MRGPWRRLALAAAINVTVGVGAAAAQSVIVRNAPAGSPVELLYNDKAIGTATASGRGEATLPFDLKAASGRQEVDVHVFIDLCKAPRRVMFIQPGLQPPAAAEGCDRREISGVFLVQPVTTFLVDLAPEKPAVWLRQGPMPPTWLTREASEEASLPGRQAPKGLVLFGGGGLTPINNFVGEACGQETDCSGKSSRPALNAGVGVWLTKYIGAQVSYLRPSNLTASGSATNYRYTSTFDPRLLTVLANLGVPIGPVRLYGQGGMNYQRATFTTTETIDDTTITVDNTTETVKGGTNTTAVQTGGWGWIFGAGMEGWVTNWIAIYAEGGRAQLKGKVRGAGEGARDDRATYLLAGIRVRVGR